MTRDSVLECASPLALCGSTGNNGGSIQIFTVVTEPSPELERHVRESFAQKEPERIFVHCKVAEQGGKVFVRIYSHHQRFPNLMPTPYQVFRFDAATSTLIELNDEEAAPYKIQNYK